MVDAHPVGDRQPPADQLEDEGRQLHRELLHQAAERQVVVGEAGRAAVEHRHLVGQRQREPDPVLGVNAHRVRVEAAVHLMDLEGLGAGVELDQPALVGRRDEHMAVLLRFGQRVDPLVGLVLGEFGKAPGEQAAQLVAGHRRDLVDRVGAGAGLDLVDPVLQVVAHVDLAVAVRQEVVHLGEAVAQRQFGDLRGRQLGRPGGRTRHLVRVGGDVLPVRLQQGRHGLLRFAGQAGAITHHPPDRRVPLGGAAIAAQERRALLVAEGALEHELLADRLVRQALGQGRGPGIGGPLFGQRPGVHFGLQRQHRWCRQLTGLELELLEAGLSQAQGERRRAGRQHRLAAGIGESRVFERALLQLAGGGIAVVRIVDASGGRPHQGGHDQAQGFSVWPLDLQRQGLRARTGQQQAGQRGQVKQQRSHLNLLVRWVPVRLAGCVS